MRIREQGNRLTLRSQVLQLNQNLFQNFIIKKKINIQRPEVLDDF